MDVEGLSFRRIPFFLLFVSFEIFPPSKAFTGEYSGSEEVGFVWHADNMDMNSFNDDYFNLRNRFNLSYIDPRFEGTLRLDSTFLLNYEGETPQAPPGKKYSNDVRIERIRGIFKVSRNLLITAGDSYVQIGNGILLSLRKISEFGMEKSLRGLRVDYKNSLVNFGLMGGITNINNVDEQYGYFYEDPMDRIIAGKLYLRPVRRAEFGVHGILLNWNRRLRGRQVSPMAYATGGIFRSNFFHSLVSIQGEFDVLWREIPEKAIGHYRMGEAGYINLHASVWRLGFLLEGKWYENFDLSGSFVGDTPCMYNQPPTTERVDQEIEAGYSVYGGRLKIDFNLGRGYSLFANLSAGDYASFTDVVAGRDANRLAYYSHLYGGLNIFWADGASELSISGGWRREMEPEVNTATGEETGNYHKRKHIYHVEGKVKWYLGRGFSLTYSIYHQSRAKKKGVGYKKYIRGCQIFGLEIAGKMALGFGFEYDTELVRDDLKRNLYGWWESRFYPVDNCVIIVRGGNEMGGLKCVSGICREIPPFAGLRADVVYRF